MSVVEFKPRAATARLECSSCGAAGSASCDCGAPYLPAGQRAEAAIAANPEKSDRAIAEEIGVNQSTVSRVRKRTDAHASVEKRTGRDGKARRLPAPTFTQDDVDEEEGVTVDTIEAANAAIRRRVFMRCAADTIRKAEQGAGLRDARGPEIDAEVLRELGRVIKAWTDLRAELKKRKETK